MAELMGGLRDAHVHLAEHGEELACVNLAACSSKVECLERLAQAARERDPSSRAWIKAVAARKEGWREAAWPTAEEIEEAAGGVAAIVMSFDHHAVVAGTSALRGVGITDAMPDPKGGVIEKRDGRCTGLLLEEACWIVRRGMPQPSDAEVRGFVARGLADLSRLGFVEVHDMLSRPLLARILLEMEVAGNLPMRVRLYPTGEFFDAMAVQSEQWESELVRLGGLKIFTDGTLGSRTAHMLSAFRKPIDGLPHGKALMSDAEIEGAVRRADAAGYPIAAHAIGDGAVRSVLDALERTRPTSLGQRVEHAQFIDEADIERFAKLGVIASVQPCHLLTDIEAIRAYAPDIEARAFPIRELVESAEAAGFDAADLVWFGSDTPIVPPTPGDNMQAAVERRRAGMRAEDAVSIGQAVPREVALACMRASDAP